MEKVEAYIDAWFGENIERFRGMASFDFSEQYEARMVFKAEVKKLIKAILETSDYQLTLSDGGE